MKGRTVLVTGGAKGIGAAVVNLFAEQGYNVILHYNTSEQLAMEMVARLQSREVNCGAFKADLSVAAEIEAMYEWSKACYGFVDTVINNAGISHFGLCGEDDFDDYRRVMDVNFGSVFGVCSLYARDMISRGEGSIVNVSSVWGERGASTESLYSASKSAIIGYSKAIAKELKPCGVRVNCLLPGFTLTDMNAEFDEAEQRSILKRMRQKRALSAEEVAKKIVELAMSDKSGAIVKAYD